MLLIDVGLLSEIVNTFCVCVIKLGFILKCCKYSGNQHNWPVSISGVLHPGVS